MKIEHLALNVDDPVMMARWYCTNLGLTVKRRTLDAPFVHFLADDNDAVMLELYTNTDAPRLNPAELAPAALHLAFRSADVSADCERLRSAGASVEAAVHRIGDDTFAMLRDPWGFPLQLVQRGRPMLPE